MKAVEILKRPLPDNISPMDASSRFVADNTVVYTTQCEGCKHMRKLNQTCDAFPDGIPDEIVGGAFDHTKPFPGDNGVTFTPK